MEEYFFECNCDRCLNEEKNFDRKQTFKCPTCNKRTIIQTKDGIYTCLKCKKEIEAKFINTLHTEAEEIIKALHLMIKQAPKTNQASLMKAG